MPVETPAQYARQHGRATAVAGSSTAVASPTGPSNGSRTVTIEHDDDDDDDAKDDAHEPTGQDQRRVGVLRLRGRALPGGPRVQWQDDVVDNEMLNRKKSKICCIYHKPKEFDESSSDESGSESASSDGSNDSRVAKPPRQRPARRHHNDDHGHDQDHEGCGLNQANTSASASSNMVTAPTAAALNAESSHDTPEVAPPEPNAYERLPHRSDKGKG
ncbi:BZ3500_MvSof-1268-A1-R1_Chr1-3g01658 [Microbotryum saponariae]|uniref:Type 1 phosphatases regulator n=1 Tax=Microbotryum saponariae TaxID=289078 RepID=A0A2X0MQS8_9BASI|nr:BZ3500_MvSof-1268-A1-R1_Chr1-3g01658 [Microbotryum saponariae]SCZ94255.1 BZ3501_MvSof-1269-A2-R1_Chr1-3g01259 [Microbotryum saponariae]